MKVELDRKALFALASDSRIEILKALQPSRRTITQLADEVGIDKAAVHRHLKKLEEGGFVTRQEDHGFVYYGLSWKARDIVSPGENTKIVIVFTSSWLFLLATVSSVVLALASAASYSANRVGEGQMAEPDKFAQIAPGIGLETVLAIVLLSICSVALAYLGYRMLRRPKQRPSEGATPDDAAGA